MPVVALAVDGGAPAWSAYSEAKSTVVAPAAYIKSQAVASGVINGVLNGLIALAAYRSRSFIPFADASADIVITVAIIAFLTSWIGIGLARQEMARRNLGELSSPLSRLRLPKGGAARGLVIAAACALGFGGVALSGLLSVISPAGVGNWAYIAFKALYTAATGALASVLAIASVVSER